MVLIFFLLKRDVVGYLSKPCQSRESSKGLEPQRVNIKKNSDHSLLTIEGPESVK